MRTKLVIAAIFAVVGIAALLIHRHRPSIQADRFDPSKNVFSAETKRILDKGETFVLFSIDPTPAFGREHAKLPEPNEVFRGYAVLGKTEIHGAADRAELLRALDTAITASDGNAADCFEPHHGARAILGDKTVDLVICFGCGVIKNESDSTTVYTTRSALPVFERILEKAGIFRTNRASL